MTGAAGGECRHGHVRRGFVFLQITRDRLGLELSDVISANIKVTTDDSSHFALKIKILSPSGAELVRWCDSTPW